MSGADEPSGVSEDLNDQFNVALKRAREIAMKFQGSSSNASADYGIPEAKKPALDSAIDSKILAAQALASAIAKKHSLSFTEHAGLSFEEVSDSMLIPNQFVGLVIGKGGETIRGFQEKSQCRMFMVQDGDFAKADEKLLTFNGPKAHVDEAKRLVREFLDEREKALAGPPGSIRMEVTVPKECVGLVIGRGGETIKRINQDTNCRVYFNPTFETEAGERICIFEGLPDDIFNAQQRVRDIVEMVISKIAPRVHQVVVPEGCELVEIPVTAEKAGLIVGRGGDFMQTMINATGAHVDQNKGVLDDDIVKLFLVSGTKKQVERVRQMIIDKVGADNVRPNQKPTNVEIQVIPTQQAAPQWDQMDPNMYYQQYGDPSSWYDQNKAAEEGSNKDAGGENADNSQYYGNMSKEEYEAAWAAYYQQYQAFQQTTDTANAENVPGVGDKPAEPAQYDEATMAYYQQYYQYAGVQPQDSGKGQEETNNSGTAETHVKSPSL